MQGWGNTDSVEYLGTVVINMFLVSFIQYFSVDPSWSAWVIGDVGNYMSDLVKYFVKLGYVRGDTIR